MPAIVNVRRKDIYEKLKKQFKFLRATLHPHLDVDTLAENGIDVSFVDLQQETRQGGAYFLPMSQSRLESFDQRPVFRVMFSMEEAQWNYSDACVLGMGLCKQLLQSHDDESLFRALDQTKWRLKMRSTGMENMLHENGGGDDWDPTRQHDWALGNVFETDPLPHQISMSTHVVPNVRGPLRSEMMIIVGVMSSRMRRRRFKDEEIFPLLLLSIIGRAARIIQAHMCPEEQRLKVRYSHLSDFSYDTSVKRDLVLRWLLSDPVTETKPMSDGDDRPMGPAGDTAPQLTAFNVTQSPPKTICRQDTSKELAAMPTEAMAERPTGPAYDSGPQMPISELTKGRRITTCYDDISRNFAAMSTGSMVSVT